MGDYRRNRVPAGTYFFTVNLLERKTRVLVDEIKALRGGAQGSSGTFVSYRLLGGVARSQALYLDIAAGLRRLPVPLESDQDRVFEIDAEVRAVVRRAHRQRRTGHLATAILGTYDS